MRGDAIAHRPDAVAQRHAMWAASLGWGLDGFDFYLYAYALPAIITAFALTKAAGGLLATYMLVASAIGGIVMGIAADRIGRKTALMICIAWYAAFTFLSGVAQSYTQLAAFRALEGFGFGGEWAVGAVLISEWSSADRRGRNLGFVQGAWALGWLAANFAFQIIFGLVGAQPGWRYLFFLGIIPALFVLYVQRSVRDAPAYNRTRVPTFTLSRIFAPDMAKTTLFATLLAVGAQSGYYALFVWLPTYLSTQRHLPSVTSGNFAYFVIGGAWVGYVTAGFINDAIGRRNTFIDPGLFCVGNFQRLRAVPERTLSRRGARDRSRLLLQYRTRCRRIRAARYRCAGRALHNWERDDGRRRMCVSACRCCRAAASGNSRKGSFELDLHDFADFGDVAGYDGLDCAFERHHRGRTAAARTQHLNVRRPIFNSDEPYVTAVRLNRRAHALQRAIDTRL
jgi:MFS family permease